MRAPGHADRPRSHHWSADDARRAPCVLRESTPPVRVIPCGVHSRTPLLIPFSRSGRDASTASCGSSSISPLVRRRCAKSSMRAFESTPPVGLIPCGVHSRTPLLIALSRSGRDASTGARGSSSISPQVGRTREELRACFDPPDPRGSQALTRRRPPLPAMDVSAGACVDRGEGGWAGGTRPRKDFVGEVSTFKNFDPRRTRRPGHRPRASAWASAWGWFARGSEGTLPAASGDEPAARGLPNGGPSMLRRRARCPPFSGGCPRARSWPRACDGGPMFHVSFVAPGRAFNRSARAWPVVRWCEVPRRVGKVHTRQ
jgi:hypothetical protein